MEVKRRIVVVSMLWMAWVLNGGDVLGADWAPIKKILISVEDNLRVLEWKYQTTTPGGSTVTIVKSVLHGGKQEGVDIVTIDNGRMTIVVVPTRGMSILGVTMGRLRLGGILQYVRLSIRLLSISMIAMDWAGSMASMNGS